ncbi:hypothetical protein ACH5RR_034375 [Cinchona calisaya]|uniref:Tr-type G domain-containing protein n=1 Tax=Cinchona calisaya TaxID=153742 RepID=A0ABD2YEN2_9GENT
MAARDAAQFTQSLLLSDYVFQGDFISIINMLQSDEDDFSALASIIQDVRLALLESNCQHEETSAAAEVIEDDHEEKNNEQRHLNVVLIGHVDAGKSTIGGQILF